MLFAQIFFWVIGIMFFAGMIGSAIVVLFTTVEDVKELREKPDPRPAVRFDHLAADETR